MSLESAQPEPADGYIGSVANDPFISFFSLVIFAPLIEEFVSLLAVTCRGAWQIRQDEDKQKRRCAEQKRIGLSVSMRHAFFLSYTVRPSTLGV